MSKEQANTFLKHRDANDPQGNIAWAARLSKKALRASQEASARIDVEREFDLTADEKLVWRLLRIPRRYIDLEHCGVLPSDKMRGTLRGLVAADVVDILEAEQAKALLPAEIRRLKAELEGKVEQRSSQPLRGRVYRPAIDGEEPPSDWDGPSSATGEFRSPTGEFRSPTGEFRSPTGEFRSPTGEFRSPTGEFRSPTGEFRAPSQEQAALLAKLSEEERAFRVETLRLHALMARQNHYEFMGLAPGADDNAVKQAYVRLARDYHPDRAAAGNLGADIELRAKIDQLFKRLGEAHKRLGTAEERSTYDRELEALASSAPPLEGKRARRPVEAQNAFKMAETFFKKKDFKSAEAHYRQAMLFDPEDPKIPTAFAFCIWLNPEVEERTRSTDAKKRLEAVLEKFKHADAAYKLGLVLRKMGDEAAAQDKFAQAHSMDANHVDAQREVRLTEMRRQKTGGTESPAAPAKDSKDAGKDKPRGADTKSKPADSASKPGGLFSKFLKR